MQGGVGAPQRTLTHAAGTQVVQPQPKAWNHLRQLPQLGTMTTLAASHSEAVAGWADCCANQGVVPQSQASAFGLGGVAVGGAKTKIWGSRVNHCSQCCQLGWSCCS